jgi:hypothetical protein
MVAPSNPHTGFDQFQLAATANREQLIGTFGMSAEMREVRVTGRGVTGLPPNFLGHFGMAQRHLKRSD